MEEERKEGGRLPEEREAVGKSDTAGLSPRANRNYKDTVFRMLFREKENLLSLYNAVAGTDYTDAAELTGHCRMLREYSLYAERVRKYAAGMKLDEAVEKAVTECIREGILADFLRKNRAEVKKVSIFEYDREEEEKKIRKAEYEYGLEKGLELGRTEMQIMMIKNLSVLKIPIEQIVQASGMEEPEVRKCLSEG